VLDSIVVALANEAVDAGLSFVLLQPASGRLIELMPEKFKSRSHFFHFAKWTQKRYKQFTVHSQLDKQGAYVINTELLADMVRQEVASVKKDLLQSKQFLQDAIRDQVFELELNKQLNSPLPVGTSSSSALVKEISPLDAVRYETLEATKTTSTSSTIRSPMSDINAPLNTDSVKVGDLADGVGKAPQSSSKSASTSNLHSSSVSSKITVTSALAMGLPTSPDEPIGPALKQTVTLAPDTWTPTSSTAHRLAIIVPFRDSADPTSNGNGRTQNLKVFLPHMIDHLGKVGKQINRDYEIFIIEQAPGYVFNKGALFNIGFDIIKERHFDYMVLHDVDQLPLNPLNSYDYWPRRPLHLCSASEQFGFKMAYGNMVGGALLLTKKQFETVNGYSNFYWGWGQEDDDFFYRLEKAFKGVDRLPKQIGKYSALHHPRSDRLSGTPLFLRGTEYLRNSQSHSQDISKDGISNLRYLIESAYTMQQGVHRVVVQLKFQFLPKDLNGNMD
jgi:hypothetical protein